VAGSGFGHEFSDPELLRRALTHRSLGSRNNERLEFLGDSVLNCIAASVLFERWPRADEGSLTRGRAALVRESSLAAIARRLGVGEQLALGPGELKSGGHRRDSILADALEAILGAIYLDAGFEACRACALAWFEPLLEGLQANSIDKDAKTQLQEWLQGRQLGLPDYQLVETRGEEHNRIFRARCVVADLNLSGEGEGGSRRLAEQAAAAHLLRDIGTDA
jgi:ribonuclease-3